MDALLGSRGTNLIPKTSSDGYPTGDDPVVQSWAQGADFPNGTLLKRWEQRLPSTQRGNPTNSRLSPVSGTPSKIMAVSISLPSLVSISPKALTLPLSRAIGVSPATLRYA